MDFWERVEEELNFQGKTKKELAVLTNIKEQTLHKAFERNSSPSAETALKIADALNVSIEKLVTGKERKPTAKDNIPEEIRNMISKMNKFTTQQKQVIFDMVDAIDKK